MKAQSVKLKLIEVIIFDMLDMYYVDAFSTSLAGKLIKWK